MTQDELQVEAVDADTPTYAGRLLVVEDEPNLLQGIKDILELDGYTVITAAHGQQALAALENAGDQLPDLIVSDIMMPYMNGLEFLAEVRKKPEWITIPFIFLTAKGEKRDIQLGKQMGVDDYLIKPFDAEDLMIAVRSKLQRIGGIADHHKTVVSGIKRSILTMLNHEFRTPLTMVVAYADMLNESRDNIEGMDEAELMLFLREMSTGADRLRHLVENFILLVELETGDARKTFEWRAGPVDNVADIVQMTHDQKFSLETVQHTCEVEIEADLPTIHADREYLRTIVRELLDNAVKFTPDPTKPIHLKTYTEGEMLYIAVTDQGRGIPQSEIDKVCDTLYQINREQFEDQGAGSGLAIVRSMMDLHGGKLTITSEHNAGSTFVLSFPVIDTTPK